MLLRRPTQSRTTSDRIGNARGTARASQLVSSIRRTAESSARVGDWTESLLSGWKSNRINWLASPSSSLWESSVRRSCTPELAPRVTGGMSLERAALPRFGFCEVTARAPTLARRRRPPLRICTCLACGVSLLDGTESALLVSRWLLLHELLSSVGGQYSQQHRFELHSLRLGPCLRCTCLRRDRTSGRADRAEWRGGGRRDSRRGS